MEEVVEETVVAEEPKNATLAEDPEPETVVEAPVEKKPGSLEAQRAALSTVAELQREAFFAADARARVIGCELDGPERDARGHRNVGDPRGTGRRPVHGHEQRGDAGIRPNCSPN